MTTRTLLTGLALTVSLTLSVGCRPEIHVDTHRHASHGGGDGQATPAWPAPTMERVPGATELPAGHDDGPAMPTDAPAGPAQEAGMPDLPPQDAAPGPPSRRRPPLTELGSGPERLAPKTPRPTLRRSTWSLKPVRRTYPRAPRGPLREAGVPSLPGSNAPRRPGAPALQRARRFR